MYHAPASLTHRPRRHADYSKIPGIHIRLCPPAESPSARFPSQAKRRLESVYGTLWNGRGCPAGFGDAEWLFDAAWMADGSQFGVRLGLGGSHRGWEGCNR
jgi:hypothetical protein